MRHVKNSLHILGILGLISAIVYYFLFSNLENIYVLLAGIGFMILLFVLSIPIHPDKITQKEKDAGIFWKDRKRNRLGLPWTFTLYMLDKDKLHIKRGLFTTIHDEVKLFRIKDISLKKGLWQKMLGLGTINCDSSDSSLQAFKLYNIKSSQEVKNMLSKLIDEARLRNRVISTESVNTDTDMFDDADGNGIPDIYE